MTIAPAGRRLLMAVGWTVVAAILALASAGLVGQLSHPPGDARREELTWAADQRLGTQLDEVSAGLADLGELVDSLADDARAALIAVSSADTTSLQEALDGGAARAATIDSTAIRLRTALEALPGDGPDAAMTYSNATLVRRAAILAALDAVAGLSDEWTRVASRSHDAASLIVAIGDHDSTLVDAAAAGVKARYATAIGLCNDALDVMAQISDMRARFVPTDEVTVLDDWIARHQRYDEALLALYTALKKSGGVRNPKVDAAYREQKAALADLPSDNRAIVVILAEVAQGGLNQAVVAIEDARGRIDEAIAEATSSEAPSSEPPASEAPASEPPASEASPG
jgi:hypothetical protein